MKNFILRGLLIVGIFSYSSYTLAQGGSIVAKCSLFPAGSFEATSSNVLGKGYKQGNKFFAKEFKVPVRSLDTDNNMRNGHMLKSLKETKFPFITVKNIKAENGKGTGTITIMDTSKEIAFTYKDLGGNKAEAKFELNLPDYKIEGLSYKVVSVDDKVEVVVKLPYEVKK